MDANARYRTRDIDLLVNPTAENSRRWIIALSQLPDQATCVLEQEPDVFADDKRYALRRSSQGPDGCVHPQAGAGHSKTQKELTITAGSR